MGALTHLDLRVDGADFAFTLDNEGRSATERHSTSQQSTSQPSTLWKREGSFHNGLKVRAQISGITGLRFAPDSVGSTSELYCTCALLGRQDFKLKTDTCP